MGALDLSQSAIGCMRLSGGTRSEAEGIAVIHAALDAGATLLDTADVYGPTEADVGHNERLVAKALSTWSREATRVHVATKGGLVRTDGQWTHDGRARHITRACEASLVALSPHRIDLYQLHAPDPRVGLQTSVRALAALERAGRIGSIGLCNVRVVDLEKAMAIAPIASVQVELGPFSDGTLRSGIVEAALARGLTVLGYAPFGSHAGTQRITGDQVLARTAVDLGVTPFEVVLAYLRGLHPKLVPLPGPSRVETARACARSIEIELRDADRAALDARFPRLALLRRASAGSPVSAAVPRATAAEGEITIIMGYPGAGKSTLVRELEADGYARFNRDLLGGTLDAVARKLDRAIASTSARRFALDNTYGTRKSRSLVLEIGRKHGLPVRCVWLETSIEDAQVNACERMVSRHGRLLEPEEIARAVKDDPNSFGPGVQFKYRRELEPPDAAEGFSTIERRAFVRAQASVGARAVVVELDGLLWRSRSGARTPGTPEDVEVDPAKSAKLRAMAREGFKLLGLTWQPGIGSSELATVTLEAMVQRLAELVGAPVDVVCCPHVAGPTACWCRKPLPGLGVVLIRRHALDPRACIHVGKATLDRTFADRLGMAYADGEAFFD